MFPGVSEELGYFLLSLGTTDASRLLQLPQSKLNVFDMLGICLGGLGEMLGTIAGDVREVIWDSIGRFVGGVWVFFGNTLILVHKFAENTVLPRAVPRPDIRPDGRALGARFVLDPRAAPPSAGGRQQRSTETTHP